MLYFVPTPIGNLSDISSRALDVLKCCEIALCEDTRVCKSLFALLNDKFNAQIAPKCFISLHSHNEREILLNLEEIYAENLGNLGENHALNLAEISANSSQIQTKSPQNFAFRANVDSSLRKSSAQNDKNLKAKIHTQNSAENLGNLSEIRAKNSAEISANLEKIRTQNLAKNSSEIHTQNLDAIHAKISANSKHISQSAKSQIYALYNALFVENKAVAYLSDAGMPCISDPGVNLVRFAQKFGIDYEVISGANALLVAAAASGFIEKEFIFLGFLSNTGTARKNELKKALQNEYPSIIYEAPKRVKSLINDICEMDESREIFIIKEISKKFEKKWLGSAKNLRQILANADIKGEFTLVIAPAKKPQKDSISLNKNDIISLSLSTKEKAKLLARLGEKSVKAWYDELSSEAKK